MPLEGLTPDSQSQRGERVFRTKGINDHMTKSIVRFRSITAALGASLMVGGCINGTADNELSHDDKAYKNVRMYICTLEKNGMKRFMGINETTGHFYGSDSKDQFYGSDPKDKRILMSHGNKDFPGSEISRSKDSNGTTLYNWSYTNQSYRAFSRYKLNYSFNKSNGTLTLSSELTYRNDPDNNLITAKDLTALCMPITLPFHPTEKGFENYLSSTSTHKKHNDSFKLGVKYKFSHLNNCRDQYKFWDDSNMIAQRLFSCRGGFVELDSPMGIEVCEVSSVSWSQLWEHPNETINPPVVDIFQSSNCRKSI